MHLAIEYFVRYPTLTTCLVANIAFARVTIEITSIIFGNAYRFLCGCALPNTGWISHTHKFNNWNHFDYLRLHLPRFESLHEVW